MSEDTGVHDQVAITVKNVHAIRDFTGEGIMACKKALDKAGGDPLIAVGVLKYSGILVNFKNGDGAERTARMARSFAAELQMIDGVISYKGLNMDGPGR